MSVCHLVFYQFWRRDQPKLVATDFSIMEYLHYFYVLYFNDRLRAFLLIQLTSCFQLADVILNWYSPKLSQGKPAGGPPVVVVVSPLDVNFLFLSRSLCQFPSLHFSAGGVGSTAACSCCCWHNQPTEMTFLQLLSLSQCSILHLSILLSPLC